MYAPILIRSSASVYVASTYKDIKLFVDISGDEYDDYDDVPFTTLVPAFILSELRTAFILGFLIYIPFIVIDIHCLKHCIRDLISIRQKYAYALYPTGLRQKRMAV